MNYLCYYLYFHVASVRKEQCAWANCKFYLRKGLNLAVLGLHATESCILLKYCFQRQSNPSVLFLFHKRRIENYLNLKSTQDMNWYLHISLFRFFFGPVTTICDIVGCWRRFKNVENLWRFIVWKAGLPTVMREALRFRFFIASVLNWGTLLYVYIPLPTCTEIK